MSQSEPTGLSVGAVSRITGVPPDTIRTWERRYELVLPARDEAGRRSYSEEQVNRLRIVARLAAHGERVGDLARLSSDELEQRLKLHRQAPVGALGVVRAVVLHPSMGPGLAGLDDQGRTLDVVAHAVHPDELESADAPDVLVVDHDVLGTDDPAARLRELWEKLGPRLVVLTHAFLSREIRRQLDDPRLRLVQGPIGVRTLRQLVLDHAGLHHVRSRPPEDVPAARFDRVQLERLMAVRPDLDCECPNHLASLVLALREFERYSLRCESRGEADARLHSDMAKGAGRARGSLESLLMRICEHDGIVP